MDWKIFFGIFTTIFLAELGDKTQLATLLFAADKKAGGMTVFLASSLALILCSLIGVMAGSLISRVVEPRALSLLAGAGFIAVGVWTLIKAW